MTRWQPTASINNLKQRARIIQSIRDFFNARGVLEIETPLMAKHTVTDPYIDSYCVLPAPDLQNDSPQANSRKILANNKPEECAESNYQTKTIKPNRNNNNIKNTINPNYKPLFLQTSPEYAMKRLLAAGSGPIYQICKSFRHDETGKIHNPEFTMLEWYRPGFDHHDLMNEMNELLMMVLNCSDAKKYSYQGLFEEYLDINPFEIANSDLDKQLQKINVNNPEGIDRDNKLNLLLTHLIEPKLGFDVPVFIYDYPASQAALSKIKYPNETTTNNSNINKKMPDTSSASSRGQQSLNIKPQGKYPVAERFEVYYKGVELANGFYELQSPNEQLTRFEKDQKIRKQNNSCVPEVDKYLIAALEHGLPDCAGVALGIDRLIMLALDQSSINDVITFR